VYSGCTELFKLNKKSKSRFNGVTVGVSVGTAVDASDSTITDVGIVTLLEQRRGGSSRRKFWRDIIAATGMKFSYSHLANILTGRRPPNDVVLKFLGIERVEGYRGVSAK